MMVNMWQMLLASWVALSQVEIMHCLVGQYNAESGPSVRESANISGEEMLVDSIFELNSQGCYVGVAKNLVVEPTGLLNENGSEQLNTQGGKRLCTWLHTMTMLHDDLEKSWKEVIITERKRIPRWNILSRFKIRFKRFPEAKFVFRMAYIDLLNKDNFGYQLPWTRGTFHYHCASDNTPTNSVFSHLCGSSFGSTDLRLEPEEVTLLLRPAPTYNTPVTVSSSTFYTLWGTISSALAEKPYQSTMERIINVGSSIVGNLKSKMTISGKIEDFWSFGGVCNFRSIFEIEWNLFSFSLCNALHGEANSGLISSIKSSQLHSVNIYVLSFNLFNSAQPLLIASVDEGMFTANYGRIVMVLSVDTDPRRVPNFEKVKSVSGGVRKAAMAGKVLGFLNSLRSK